MRREAMVAGGIVAALLTCFPSTSFADDRERSESGLPIADLDETGAAQQTSVFKAELKQLGFSGTLTACRRVVFLWVESHDGNESYGGSCELDIGKRRV